MNKKPQIIVDVAPLIRLPLSGSQSFSYLHDESLSPGTLVSIPLFKRKVEGIVLDNRNDFHRFGNIRLKKIEKVLEENFLGDKQLKLAEFISEYYFSPLGIVLKSFIPKRVTARNKNYVTHNEKIKSKIILTEEQEWAVLKIIKKHSKFEIRNSKFLLYGPSGSGKTEVYIHSILKLSAKGGSASGGKAQFLILLPELMLTPQAIERYGTHFKPEEIAVLHSKISKGDFYENWKKIKSGEAKIIIGTRMAVFAPFKNLKLIVIDEEQDMSFKQWDMNPRYDARTAAEKLAEIHKCGIVFGSATPRIETYQRAANKKYKLLELPALKIPGSKHEIPDTHIELVDLKKERWQKNYSTISKKLQAEIAYALRNKLQTILFINRQGMSTFSICASCKTVLKCPRCDRALVYGNQGDYHCIHCSYKTSIIPQCAKCKSITFANIGLGTQKVEREIISLFPDARVIRADSQSTRPTGAQEKIYEKFKNHEADILVGTQMISKGWDLPSVVLVGIIDGDNLLSFPDFSTSERAFQNVIQAAGRVSRPGAKFPGQVLIQTFNPEQNFWKTVTEKNYLAFYEKEISERKELKFPPFAKIIKLTFQGYDLKKVASETGRLYEKLKNYLEKTIVIAEPHDAFVPKIRGRFRQQIIIKLAGATPDGQKIKNILSSLPTGWIIDIDPISIL